ncbi:hypothetical protein SALBM311S_09080 [Streptomyces alboniger]
MPPEKAASALTNPSTVRGTPSGNCRTVKYTPRSWGTESKPHACTSRAPGLTRACVMTDVRQVHELRLSREVEIVGAGVRARGDEVLAVRHVGAHRRGHHARVLGERAHRGPVDTSPRSTPTSAPPGSRSHRFRSFASLRPATAQRSPSGACAARYSAVSVPTKPVAPKRTMPYGRSVPFSLLMTPLGLACAPLSVADASVMSVRFGQEVRLT